MTDQPDDTISVLEQFRKQWREEVSARSRGGKQRASQDPAGPLRSFDATSRTQKAAKTPPSYHPAAEVKDDGEVDTPQEDDVQTNISKRIERLDVRDIDDDEFTPRASMKEPRSALEHYEKAVEKENQGSLGDSLSHYRKAYRLDARVDQSYKSKHFPTKSKPGNPNPSNAPVTVPPTSHHSSKEPSDTNILATSELIASFVGLPILPARPLIEGDKPPPCPIADLPSEVLLEILWQAALFDPASFVRLGTVCKRLTYHVFTEHNIWKRIALGSKFGLASQLYEFKVDIRGHEAIGRLLEKPESKAIDHESLLKGSKYRDWREVFQSYPRIRFTGVYISTVNYTRPGGSSTSQTSWNTPVHIVTYYRYLRFFRDGTVISLLTTHEPIDVVHHLTLENADLARSGGKDQHPLNFTSSAPAIGGAPTQHVPPTAQNLMKHALLGRWRLCHPSADSQESVPDIATGGLGATGDLHIETEGAGPRYMYTMHLVLKSSSRSEHSVKNNKLQWKGFWSYNQLTSDWAEFQLKNDKAFFFSRVKSYGLGY